jgi:hypothetical protein
MFRDKAREIVFAHWNGVLSVLVGHVQGGVVLVVDQVALFPVAAVREEREGGVNTKVEK